MWYKDEDNEKITISSDLDLQSL
jgi:hypothetical protein